MGLKHLMDIYSLKGRDFIDKLFSTYVTINEKMDGSAFIMEKNPGSGRLEYFKKSSNKPIDSIDRILAKYYEPAINHFDNLDFNTRNKVPVGWSFGFEYFVDNKPVEIEYDEVPENNLMLSYIHIKDKDGKIVKTIQDKKDLDNWAKALKVSPPPIIFQGIIDKEQKIKILEFLDTPFNELVDRFKTESFVEYIINILNPKMLRTSLNKDLTSPIEGTVFRFGAEEDENVFSAKLVDPVFTQLAREKAKTKVTKKPNDTYNLTVLEMMNFIDMLTLKRFSPIGKNFEDRYISFICLLFNAFIKEDGNQFKDLDFDIPEYMKKDYFGIGIDFIPNLETRRLIKENPSFEQLFKIMLAAFRKKKKKTTPLFTKELVLKFNITVDNIYKHITVSKIEEGGIPAFKEFYGDTDFGLVEDEVLDSLNGSDKPVSPKGEKEITDDTESDIEKGIKKVNILVGRFQPFHNGHMKMNDFVYDKNKLPTVLVIVHPEHNKSGKSPFDKSMMNTIVSGLIDDSNGIIIDHVFIKTASLENIIEVLRPKYEPVLWGAGEDRIDSYQKQIDHNLAKNNPLNTNIEVVKTARSMSGSEAREAIENDDFATFTRLVPKSIQALWLDLKNNISESAKLYENMMSNSYGYFNTQIITPEKENIAEIHFRMAPLVKTPDDARRMKELYLGIEKKAKAFPYYRKLEEVIKGRINENSNDNNLSEGDCVLPTYSILDRFEISKDFDHFLFLQDFSLEEMEIISSAVRTLKLPQEISEDKGLHIFDWHKLLEKEINLESFAKFLKFEVKKEGRGKAELPIAMLFESGYLAKAGDVTIAGDKFEVKSGSSCKLGGTNGFVDGGLTQLRNEIQNRTDFDIFEGVSSDDFIAKNDSKEEKERVKKLKNVYNLKESGSIWPGLIPRISDKEGLIEAFVNYFCERWKFIRKYPHLKEELKTFFTEWALTGSHRDGFAPLGLIQAKYYQLVEGFKGIISVKRYETHTIFINPSKITIDEFKSVVAIGSLNWDHHSSGKILEFRHL